MNPSGNMLTVRVRLHDPAVDAAPRWVEYQVPRERARRVLDVVEYIQEELNPNLGFRPHVCRDLCCGVCWVKVNGHSRMACSTPLQSLDTITLEPVSSHSEIRDLIVDFSHPI